MSNTTTSSYPGGKSGSGIYQRLINLIPPHRVLIVPFAGHCGVTRNIKPAEHTIVIDANPEVCEWWASWRRSKQGRDLEIHNCDGIEWIRYRFGVTEYSDAEPRVAAGDVASRSGRVHHQPTIASACDRRTDGFDADSVGSRVPVSKAASAGRPTIEPAAEAFIFCDPPYVLSERSTGKIYDCELTDDDHGRLLEVLTTLDATRYQVMLCGYNCDLYASLDPWHSIDHRVPTRGGLQDERIWMNYGKPIELHDYRYIGNCRRSRERIRRRQVNWREQLQAMNVQERRAMLEVLNGGAE